MFPRTFDFLSQRGWSTRQVSWPEACGMSRPQSPGATFLVSVRFAVVSGSGPGVSALLRGPLCIVRDFLWGVLSSSCVGRNWDGPVCGCLRSLLAERRGPGLGYHPPAWPLPLSSWAPGFLLPKPLWGLEGNRSLPEGHVCTDAWREPHRALLMPGRPWCLIRSPTRPPWPGQHCWGRRAHRRPGS